MSNRSAISDRVLCPYYVNDKNNGITCEAVCDDALYLRSIYQSNKDKYSHMNSFCCSKCWQGCPVTALIESMQ